MVYPLEKAKEETKIRQKTQCNSQSICEMKSRGMYLRVVAFESREHADSLGITKIL